MGFEYTLLSKLTSSSAATPPELGGESRKASCKSLLFHKITFARRQSQMPAFEDLLMPSRAAATVLHGPQLLAPAVSPSSCPFTSSSPCAMAETKSISFPKKMAGTVREVGRDGEPWELRSSTGGFPSPRTAKQPISVLSVMEELSFLQPSQLGCWLGFLKQSLASSLAAIELVCLVRLVWRTALIPISSHPAGRGLGALHAGGQHHPLELGASEVKAFPHTQPTSMRDLASGCTSFDVLLAQPRAPGSALFNAALRHPLTRS